MEGPGDMEGGVGDMEGGVGDMEGGVGDMEGGVGGVSSPFSSCNDNQSIVINNYGSNYFKNPIYNWLYSIHCL